MVMGCTHAHDKQTDTILKVKVITTNVKEGAGKEGNFFMVGG